MGSSIAFFLLLCANIELCKFVEGFPRHSFFKKKSWRENKDASKVLNRNIDQNGSCIVNPLNFGEQYIYGSLGNNSSINSLTLEKGFNSAVRFEEKSKAPDFSKNDSFGGASDSMTASHATNLQAISNRESENYHINNQKLFGNENKISNNSLLNKQKSGLFGVIPRNIVNFRRFTTTTEVVTTLRPWQVSCCPQDLNRNYTEPASGRPWDICSPQTCFLSEVTSNTTRSNQTESSTIQNLNNTITNQTQGGLSTVRVTTALNTTNTSSTNQMKSQLITTPITTPKYFKAIDLNVSEITRPTHKNPHSTNHVKNRKQSSSKMRSTSHTRVHHATEAYNKEVTNISGTTSKPDTFILPLVNIANETAIKLILQYPARVIPVKVDNPASGNISVFQPTSLEQVTIPTNKTSSNIGNLTRRNTFEDSISISENGKKLFNKVYVPKLHSGGVTHRKDILSETIQIKPNKFFHDDDVKKRSVHIDFFSLGRSNKCTVKTTKRGKVKYQSAPFYNLTSLLGPICNQKGAHKKIVFKCTDEPTSLTTSVKSSTNLTTTTTSGNASVAALNNTRSTSPSADRTKSTVPPVFKLKIGLLDMNSTGGTTERLVQVGADDTSSSDVTEAGELTDYAATTCAGAGPATACTIDKAVLSTEAEDAALTATEDCTNQTTIKYIFKSTFDSSSDENTSNSTSIDELSNPELVDPAIYRGKLAKLNPNLENLNEIKKSKYIKRRLKASDVGNISTNNYGKFKRRNVQVSQNARFQRNNFNKIKTGCSSRPRQRKKRTSSFEYNLMSPQNKTGFVYAIIPPNQDTMNSKFMEMNETNMNEQLIRPRSIFGQLLPCCMSKTIKPKDHEKKPWELPWTPKIDRFRLYTDEITQQPIDVRDIHFFPSLLPHTLTTPQNHQFYDNTEVCPTCGYKSNLRIVNSQKLGPMQIDTSETQENSNLEKQGNTQYELLGSQQDRIPQNEGDIHYEISRGQERPSNNPFITPSSGKYWGSEEMECDCCVTYTLNYPKHFADDVYSVNKRATTIKSLRLIEKLNDRPKYYIEIPEALGDLIKKAASKSSATQTKNYTHGADIIFKKKGKVVAKGMPHSTSDAPDKGINNTKSEPVFIIIPPESVVENRVSVPLDYLYKLLESNVRLSTTLLPQSGRAESDLLRDAPVRLQQDSHKAMTLADNLLPLRRIPFVLIPAYLPLEKGELIHEAPASAENTNGKFERPHLVLNPSDVSLVLGPSKVQDIQDQFIKMGQNKFKSRINEIINQINGEKYNQYPDNLRAYPEESNSLSKYEPSFSGFMNDSLDLSPLIEIGKNPKYKDSVLSTGSANLMNGKIS